MSCIWQQDIRFRKDFGSPQSVSEIWTSYSFRYFCTNYEKHATRVSHSYRGSRQGLVQARTLARCSRKSKLIHRINF